MAFSRAYDANQQDISHDSILQRVRSAKGAKCESLGHRPRENAGTVMSAEGAKYSRQLRIGVDALTIK